MHLVIQSIETKVGRFLTVLRVTPPATSERWVGLLGSSPIPRFSCRFLRLPSTEAPSLHRNYSASWVLPLRHPIRPGLFLASCQLIPTAIAAGPMEPVRSYCSIVIGLPRYSGGSAPALPISRPAQRSRLLRPTSSPSHHLCAPSIEGSRSFVASTAAPIATGRSEPVPGRDFHPLKTNAFSRRTE